MELKRSSTSLSKDEIKGFEKSFDITLPESFIDFYLQANGGSPSLRYFEEYRISAFLPIKHGEGNTVESKIEILKLAERLPEKYIPFAFDGGGWYFCVDAGETNYGSIYVLPNGLLESEPIFIVSSFSEFINGLSEEEY